MLAAVTACRAPAPRVTAAERTPPPPAAHELGDDSYDWHGLVIAPFGSVLKDVPTTLHEVLLFREEVHGNAAKGNGAGDAAAVDAECYAADAPAPRFIGRISDEYLLCFQRGRLSRIQASVRLATARAPEVFAAACAGWLKNAAPASSRAEAPSADVRGGDAPSADAPAADPESGGACEGRDGDIRFRGRLEEEPDRAEVAQTETVLSITLDSAPKP